MTDLDALVTRLRAHQHTLRSAVDLADRGLASLPGDLEEAIGVMQFCADALKLGAQDPAQR
jgi:hypothetical protein